MHRTANRLVPLAVLALAASLTLAACGGSSYSAGSSSTAKSSASSGSPSNAPAGQAGGAVRTASNSALAATVLTNAQGITLYALSAERAGTFICTGSCLQVWHPVSAAAGTQPRGSVGSLGTIKRPEGGEQVTYKGMPLYTFASDTQPGDAKGQGLKDIGTWAAVTIAVGAPSAPTRTSTAATTSSQPAPSGSGGGYR
jgi:predicted lipoprotein with Yx(FWY)xxD motif